MSQNQYLTGLDYHTSKAICSSKTQLRPTNNVFNSSPLIHRATQGYIPDRRGLKARNNSRCNTRQNGVPVLTLKGRSGHKRFRTKYYYGHAIKRGTEASGTFMLKQNQNLINQMMLNLHIYIFFREKCEINPYMGNPISLIPKFSSSPLSQLFSLISTLPICLSPISLLFLASSPISLNACHGPQSLKQSSSPGDSGPIKSKHE